MFNGIRVNYEGRDFFGNYVARSDRYDGRVDARLADKVLRGVMKGGMYAHFTRDDGTDECVYMEGGALGDGMLTLVHFNAWNSKDAPEKLTVRDFKARIRAELEG